MSTTAEIKAIIQKELPEILVQDMSMRDFVLRTVSQIYAGKQETESKFDRILAELQRDREEQARKWDEQNQKWDEFKEFTKEQARKWDEQNQKWDEFKEFTKEQARKWDEQNQKWDEFKEFTKEQARKWDEQNQKNNEILQEIQKMNKKHDSTIGALGSRWGINAESSFRSALKAILEDSFGVQVINVNDYDHEGEVFVIPDQVEIDIIIQNGIVIACEIKSSMSKSDIHTFERKVQFYQKHHGRTVNRKIVISPMVDAKALMTAERLGMEVYGYVDNILLDGK